MEGAYGEEGSFQKRKVVFEVLYIFEAPRMPRAPSANGSLVHEMDAYFQAGTDPVRSGMNTFRSELNPLMQGMNLSNLNWDLAL